MMQYASTLLQGIAQCLGEADVQTCLQWAQAYPAIDSGVSLSARVRPSAATEDRFDANAFESTAVFA